MTHTMFRALALLLLFTFLSPVLAAPAEKKERCPICGMFVKENAANTFRSARDGKPVHFCSFACAHAFHRKHPEAKLEAFDYDSGKAVAADNAWFLAKSEKLADEFKHAMPPVVAAFSTEEGAKKAKSRLGEGEIIKGFSALKQ